MNYRFNVEDYMVKYPYIGNRKMKVAEAFNFLKNCNIRHLPIIEKGKVVGIVSDRDLREAKHFEDPPLLVEDVMKTEPFMVPEGTKLADVADVMAKGKYGCTVVQDRSGRLTGIFTTTDAMRLLALILRESPETRFHALPVDTFVREEIAI